MTIPNTVLTTQELTRPYSRRKHRIVQELGVAYEDDISKVLVHLEEVAAEMDQVLAVPSPDVFIDELGNDEVTIRNEYWIDNPTRHDVFAIRSMYARGVKARLEDEGFTLSPATKRDLQGGISIKGSTRRP